MNQIQNIGSIQSWVLHIQTCVYGIANDVDYQPTVTNLLWKLGGEAFRKYFRKNDKTQYFDILKPMDAIMRPGELTVVLGRPGAGCSTLLKQLLSTRMDFMLARNQRFAMMD